MAFEVKVKKDGTIKLPKEIMDLAFVAEGDILSLDVIDNKIVMTSSMPFPKKFYKFLEEKAQQLHEHPEKYNVGSIKNEQEFVKALAKMMEIEDKNNE